MISLLLFLTACAPLGTTTPSPDAPDPSAAKPAPEQPGSIYDLAVDLEDQHGDQVGFDHHRDHPAIVSMFYASCPTACPLLIHDVQALEAELSPEVLAQTRVLLVSMDPAADDPAALAEVVERYGLDDARWTLARSSPEDVRVIAAVLGVSYRTLPGGGMNHSSILTAVDQQGHILTQQEGLGVDRSDLVSALTTATGS